MIPARFKVIVTRRPKYACRECDGEVAQAPAPEHLIEGGIPTEALIAAVVIAKYADHLPLYRQAQIYGRQGVELDRSTLADWSGRAAFALRPVYERLFDVLKGSDKLFADETRAPVLVWADGGYNARQVEHAVAAQPPLRVEIVKRPDDSAGFIVLPRRWVVERTFSWFGRNRRLAKDYENLADALAAFITLACIQLAVRRLARP